LKVHDSVPLEEDLVFTDERLSDVVGARPEGVFSKVERAVGRGEKV
jgi:hypothetical protein